MIGGSETQQDKVIAEVPAKVGGGNMQQTHPKNPNQGGGGQPSVQKRAPNNNNNNSNMGVGNKRPFQKREGSGGGGIGNFKRPNNMNNSQSNPFIGPTTNLQPRGEGGEKKGTGKCRLFVGNLTPDVDEQEFRKLFEPYGALTEVFLNAQKGFGFVKMESRPNAEAARSGLDGVTRKGRLLRVRFATHGAAVRVKNLSPFVSNELLELAFETFFGEVERAVVVVDDRGKPTGEGIVEFARKPGAVVAIKRCAEGCFMLTGSPRPLIVEQLEYKDDEEGYPDKVVPKSNSFLKERDIGPHFAQIGTFEYEFGNKWKQLYELEKQKRDALEKQIKEERDRLEDQMELAFYEHETNLLREKLRKREEDANNLMMEREMRRREYERMRDQQMKRQDNMMHHHQAQQQQQQQQQQQPNNYNMMRNDEMRRRQEDSLLLQASHLSNLLDQQEQAIMQMQGGTGVKSGLMGGRGQGNNGHVGASTGGPNRPAGPVMGGGPTGGMGPNGPIGRQSRFEQGSGPSVGPSPSGPISRGGGGGMGLMGGPMGCGDMRAAGGGMGRRDLMDRRDHRDDYDPKRRRY